jgi:MFS transporter, SP family, sugar:H+ symporter
MCICEFIVAVVGVTAGGQAGHIVLIVFVCIYIFFFACTWGPTGWAVSGEIFPLSIRSKGVALSTASNWLWNFIISFATPYIVEKDKGNLMEKVFFIWGSTCLACVLFSYFCVYETKGLSLEQVDRMMKETTPRNSARWNPDIKPREDQDVEKAAEQTSESSPSPSQDRARVSSKWNFIKNGVSRMRSVGSDRSKASS